MVNNVIYEGMEFKKWDIFFNKITDKIFEINELEPTIYYRKVDLLRYALKLKSLISISKVYINYYKDEIFEIDKIVNTITTINFMSEVKAEVIKFSKDSNYVAIPTPEYLEIVNKLISIFEKVVYNLSYSEILPKFRTSTNRFIDEDLPEDKKKYFEFVNYLEK